MPRLDLRNVLATVFGIVLLLCTYALLFRDTSRSASIVTVIGLVIGGLLLTVFWEHLSEFTLGPLNAKVRDLGQRVDEQSETINAIRTALEGIITQYEYEKLVGLETGAPFICTFNDNMGGEMKHLYDLGFVKETEFGSGPKLQQHRGSGQAFDLKWHFLLTDSGRKYLESRRRWEVISARIPESKAA